MVEAFTAGLRVSLGPYWYDVERPWGLMSAGQSLGRVSDVAVLSNGDVVAFQQFDSLEVTATATPPFVVFNRDGRHLRSFGAGLVADAHGLVSDSADHLIATDRDAHEVLVLDAFGKVRLRLGQRHGPGAPFRHPTAAAVAGNGDIYVADGYGGWSMHRFSSTGELLRSWGGPGHGHGRFLVPHAVRVLADGRVLVADRDNNRIEVFDEDGAYLDSWDVFSHPTAIHVSADGFVFVVDRAPRMTVLDHGGRVIDGCRPVASFAHGISEDSKGNIYLAEPRERRITRLRRSAVREQETSRNPVYRAAVEGRP